LGRGPDFFHSDIIKMSKKKRHHYLARFYLNGFIDPINKPYIWIYEKGNPEIRKASSKDIAVKKYYYSFIRPDESKDVETLENAFAQFEDIIAPVIKKITSEVTLNEDDKRIFSLFLAYSIVKVPNFRESIEETNSKFMKHILQLTASHNGGLESIIQNYEKETGKKIGISPEELRKWILDDKKYEIKTRPEFSLAMLPIATELAPVFYNMKWCFVGATDEYKFPTCDNPFFFCDPTHDHRSFYGVGLLAKNTEISFPISRNWLLSGTWEGREGQINGTNALVKEFTRRTVCSAQRYVFASEKSESLNRMVQKYVRSAPRIQIGGL